MLICSPSYSASTWKLMLNICIYADLHEERTKIPVLWIEPASKREWIILDNSSYENNTVYSSYTDMYVCTIRTCNQPLCEALYLMSNVLHVQEGMIGSLGPITFWCHAAALDSGTCSVTHYGLMMWTSSILRPISPAPLGVDARMATSYMLPKWYAMLSGVFLLLSFIVWSLKPVCVYVDLSGRNSTICNADR